MKGQNRDTSYDHLDKRVPFVILHGIRNTCKYIHKCFKKSVWVDTTEFVFMNQPFIYGT